MRLNPVKYTFIVTSDKFLEFMVSRRGIKANLEKIKAILMMTLPKTVKEVQRLIDKIASFNYFIYRSTERCLSFFQTLKWQKDF